MSKNLKRKTSRKNRSKRANLGDGSLAISRPGMLTFKTSMTKGNPIMKVARKALLSSFVTNVGGATNAVYSFQLSDVDNYTEFTNLYDQYRIRRIDLQFIPFYTQSTPGAGACSGVIYAAPDFDDISATASAALRQYPACQVFGQTERIQVTVEPRLAVAAYSGTFTSYANLRDQWIDCNSPSVQHYGFKLAADASGGTANSFQVIGTYHLEFRSAR